MSRLGRGDFNGMDLPPVVVLAYHVDYWDYMGWKDPFGSSQWTVRQKAYVEALGLDTMFTPQIVLQGRAQCVGNDESALLSSIRGAPRYAAPTFQVCIFSYIFFFYFKLFGCLFFSFSFFNLKNFFNYICTITYMMSLSSYFSLLL